MSGIFDMAKEDAAIFTQEISLTFFRVANVNEKTVLGTASRHHLGIDPETGNQVNSRKVTCTVSESLLTAQGYTTRDSSGNVNLVNTFVKYNDGTGTVRTYKIVELFTDDTLGLIVCVLGQWQA